MALLNTQDKALQAAALKAGFRTFEQVLSAGLGVGTIGGVAVGVSVDATGQVHFATSWQVIAIAAAFLLVSAGVAGLRSYLSMSSSGLPQQYIDAALAAVQTSADKAEASLAAKPATAQAQLETVSTPEQAAVAVLNALATTAVAQTTATGNAFSSTPQAAPVPPAGS